MIDNTPSKMRDNDDVTNNTPHFATHSVIVADVLFGSPRSNCSGQGICQVIAPVHGQLLNGDQWSCKRSVALIRLISDELVAFHFVKASMCSQVLQNHFEGSIFVIEDAVSMTLNTWQQTTWEIKPGYYPISNQKNYFTTIFKIKSQISRDKNIGLYLPHNTELLNNGGG